MGLDQLAALVQFLTRVARDWAAGLPDKPSEQAAWFAGTAESCPTGGGMGAPTQDEAKVPSPMSSANTVPPSRLVRHCMPASR